MFKSVIVFSVLLMVNVLAVPLNTRPMHLEEPHNKGNSWLALFAKTFLLLSVFARLLGLTIFLNYIALPRKYTEETFAITCPDAGNEPTKTCGEYRSQPLKNVVKYLESKQSLKKLDVRVVFREEPCVVQGGMCMASEHCDAGDLVRLADLCPKQSNFGVVCCYLH